MLATIAARCFSYSAAVIRSAFRSDSSSASRSLAERMATLGDLLAVPINQTIPAIIAARERPQRALLWMLLGLMAFSVFFVARAAAREVRVAEMKSNFVSSVSHDLKTPLALIQLFAETLELGRLKNTDRAQE